MPTNRLAHVDGAKGIAITAIVLVHANAVLPGREHISLGAAASIALAVLFLVSGFVSGGRFSDAAPAGAITSRVVALSWLYALWQPVVVVQRTALAWAEGRTVDVAGEVARFLAAPVRPNGELWYLWALALHLVLVALTRRLPAWSVLVPSATLFVVINGIGEQLVGDVTWHMLGPGLQGLPQFAFFTILGSRLRVLLPVQRPRVLGLLTTGASVLLLFLLVVRPGPWFRPAETVLGVITALGLASLASQCSALRLLARIGRDSVAPYLMHMSVLTLLTVLVTGSSSPGAEAGWAGARPLFLVGASAIAISVSVAVLGAVRGTRAELLFRAPDRVVEQSVRWLTAARSGLVPGR
ncbi:acyltransferase family protein [Curtobacterium sp. MCSS17_015]|uniref:acyltransferase family protein n=1 Tax=Curtobacterium sp. MCSS17_015 TaxID=2175666 RepID=UPI000DAA02A2|nr:acyltransferase family protein [Curtobacterium sp. MCSS17_015]WIB26924.1 acyltransferase family protein [Curtobacterium sp. MCSS17_015]